MTYVPVQTPERRLHSASLSWPLILCTFKLQDLLIVLIECRLDHSLIITSVSSCIIW